VKAAEARRLATEHDQAALAAAIARLMDEQDAAITIEGEDHGEKLTNCLLAARIRERVDRGEPLKDAFRAVMAEVRVVVSNE
jgi:hypothetical protein